MIKRLLAALFMGIFLLAALFGCAGQKKPFGVGQGNPPAPTAPAPQDPLPKAPNEADRLANALAAEALKIEGVKGASVVLTGSTALVGIDLNPGADANIVKERVANTLRNANNQVANVLVSTDPEISSRIAGISKGVAEGRPLSSFSAEVNEIIKRLSPS